MQVVDPFVSPPLTLLTAVDVVRRFNACLPHKGHSPKDPVNVECNLLKEIAKKVVNKYVNQCAMRASPHVDRMHQCTVRQMDSSGQHPVCRVFVVLSLAGTRGHRL